MDPSDFDLNDPLRDPNFEMEVETFNESDDLSNLQNVNLTENRKRKCNGNLPKQCVRKRNRQHGQAYISSKGLPVEKKQMKPPCTSCVFSCAKNITNGDRETIFNSFWSLNDVQKNYYYSQFVKNNTTKRRRVKNSVRKNFSFEYTLKAKGKTFRVCKKFFLNTLSISERRIYYHFKNLCDKETGVVKELRRGKHVKNCISNECRKNVIEHIKSFPVVDSHYGRAGTSRKYLEEGLSINKMFRLFQEKFPHNSISLSTFTKIFKSDFNLGFCKAKKDQSDRCVHFKKQFEINQIKSK